MNGRRVALKGLTIPKLRLKFRRNSKSLDTSRELSPAISVGPEAPCWKVPYDSPIEALVAASSYLRDRNAEASCFMPYECPTCGKIHLTKVSQKERLNYLRNCERGLSDLEFPKKMLKKAFREQMLRETIEGYLGTGGHRSLTEDQIEMLLRQGMQMRKIIPTARRHYGTVSGSIDQQSL